ncbi:hypothetical protein Glove_67g147 [Diversispora epigaea]|uniref:Uncharacterized protein n=1 Tax=Diversispora epigaea TaxID=1348612 RepID=A0A397JCJ1_9GLOM|nr:hypothetical protein Glove_67g147 [Diversispora epigaea]
MAKVTNHTKVERNISIMCKAQVARLKVEVIFNSGSSISIVLKSFMKWHISIQLCHWNFTVKDLIYFISFFTNKVSKIIDIKYSKNKVKLVLQSIRVKHERKNTYYIHVFQ